MDDMKRFETAAFVDGEKVTSSISLYAEGMDIGGLLITYTPNQIKVSDGDTATLFEFFSPASKEDIRYAIEAALTVAGGLRAETFAEVAWPKDVP